MLKRLILISIILLRSSCFAYIKQNDEYTCAPISAFNLIDENCSDCQNFTEENLKKLFKTDLNGTTAQNLCEGLEKYFISQNLNAEIKYFGIKKVKKYKAKNEIDLQEIQNHLENGYSAILNLGIYRNSNRIYGHYLNLISINGNKLKVFDPYGKKDFSKLKVKEVQTQLNNINDNEEYLPTDKYLKIKTPINYLKKDETAFINGVILVKISK